MSVRLRLQRFGAKKRPYYRIVAADQRSPRDGRYRELLGTFDPMNEPNVVDLKIDRVEYWLGVGAQPSDRVESVIANFKAGKYISTAQYIEANKENRRRAREAALSAKPVEPLVPKPAAPVEAAAEPAEEPVAEAPVAEEPVAEGGEA